MYPCPSVRETIARRVSYCGCSTAALLIWFLFMHKFNPKTKHNLYFQLLSTSGIRLLEPIMAIKIIAPNERISGIIADLSRRRAIIKEVTSKSDKNKVCRIYPMCKLKIKKKLVLQDYFSQRAIGRAIRLFNNTANYQFRHS